MYVTKHHQLDDREAMFSLMDAYPLGAWVCAGQDGLVANHVPFLLDRNQGPAGTLIGHVARANPVWRALHTATPSVVLFQGPQSYITPGWYPGKAEHGKVVPTWNHVNARSIECIEGHAADEQRGNLCGFERHTEEARDVRGARRALKIPPLPLVEEREVIAVRGERRHRPEARHDVEAQPVRQRDEPPHSPTNASGWAALLDASDSAHGPYRMP